jgi:hypothetical protein
MEQLNIKYAADAAPLVADRFCVQCYSSCARGLPAAAEEWDISQLLPEGQPVQRETVVCWLNSVYGIVEGENLEYQEPSPSGSMAGLAQLLAFADAVGTSRGLLLVLDEKVSAAGSLVAEVQMGKQQLQLAADSCHVFYDMPLELCCLLPSTAKYCRVGTGDSAEEKEGLRQQFAQQVEALLYLAYKLQLPQLQQVVRQCISCNSCTDFSLLDAEAMRAVASPRVLDAAGGCGDAQRAFIASCGFELGAFAEDSWSTSNRQLLRPLGLTPENHKVQPIKFSAELMRDLFCFKEGEVVNVELDLFKTSTVKLCRACGMDWASTELTLDVDLALGTRQLLDTHRC